MTLSFIPITEATPTLHHHLAPPPCITTLYYYLVLPAPTVSYTTQQLECVQVNAAWLLIL